MYTGVCLDVMYVTILAIEYSIQMYQCLKLVVITAQLCNDNCKLCSIKCHHYCICVYVCPK